MPQLLEALMIIFFGLSWPAALYKSYKARTTRGKSIIFLFCVLSGYAFGIAAKIFSGAITYVFIFYCINFTMVAADICLYFKNKKLDSLNEEK